MKETKRHPADVMLEGRGIAHAARRFAKWRAKHSLELEAIMLIYSDDEAIQLLEVLREDFWSEL